MSKELTFPCWVLDCPWTYCGHTRTADGILHRRDRGRIHLYAPGGKWIEDNHDAGAHESCYILFDGGEALGLDCLTEADGYARIYDPELAVGHLISAMAITGATHGNRGVLEALGYLYQIAGRLLYADSSDFTYMNNLETKLRNYFEAHFREKHSLKSIATALGMSRSSLTHRCRAEVGKGAMALLTEIRLEQSIPMLLRGQTLKHVASSSGYDDMFHYSRLFKKHYGMSPKHYKEAHLLQGVE